MLRVIETIDDVVDFTAWLSEQQRVAVDTETNGLELYSPTFKVRLVQIGSRDAAWVIDLERWLGLLQDVFRRFQGQLTFHHARFDVTGLRRHGIKVRWAQVDDTMIALRLAEPDKSAGLKEAAGRHVSATAAQAQTDLDKAMKVNKWTWATVPLDFEPYLFYAGLDPVLTARLRDTPIVDQAMRTETYALEMQVRAICCEMEHNGLGIDVEHCVEMSGLYSERAGLIKDDIDKRYGFNITSTEQLAHHLMSTPARRHMTKVTPGGRPSVDAEVLEVLAEYEAEEWGWLAATALEVRKLDKTRVTYLDHLVDWADENDCVHALIETLAARTGRMGVRTPPLQTLPVPSLDPDTRVVRQAVIPRQEDHVLLCADYDQIELRMGASVSGDANLIEAFKVADESGIDFFTASARDVYGDKTIVKSDPRRAPVKSYWYSALFGAGVETQAWTAKVSVARMQELRDAMVAKYPGFAKLMAESTAMARASSGWIETPYGRRLKVPEDKLYVATNYRIQGGAADVMKRAIVTMGQAGLEDLMVVPVHDEILLSVPDSDVEEVGHLVQQSMECHDFAVPLTTGLPVQAANWAEAK